MLKPYTRAQVAFEELEEIGFEGKNSKAFIAYDHQLDAKIVVKKIKKSRMRDEEAFFHESRLLYKSAHPNVVKIHYACTDESFVYLAMPYYRNGSLKSLMEKRFLTVREIVRFACQMLAGLHNVHSKGLIHFDIKPDNILLSDRCEALVSDFGLARYLEENGFARVPYFYWAMVPPERLDRREFSTSHDIYQIGLTLYRMCNGEKEFYSQLEAVSGDDEQYVAAIAEGKFPNRKAFLPHIPQRLRSVVRRCLSVNPADRYRAAIDVANDLAVIEGEILDWQYEIDSGAQVWSKAAGEAMYKLVVDQTGASELTKVIGEGKPRRIAAGCMNTVTGKDVGKILGSY